MLAGAVVVQAGGALSPREHRPGGGLVGRQVGSAEQVAGGEPALFEQSPGDANVPRLPAVGRTDQGELSRGESESLRTPASSRGRAWKGFAAERTKIGRSGSPLEASGLPVSSTIARSPRWMDSVRPPRTTRARTGTAFCTPAFYQTGTVGGAVRALPTPGSERIAAGTDFAGAAPGTQAQHAGPPDRLAFPAGTGESGSLEEIGAGSNPVFTKNPRKLFIRHTISVLGAG